MDWRLISFMQQSLWTEFWRLNSISRTPGPCFPIPWFRNFSGCFKCFPLLMAIQPTPFGPRTPPRNKALWSGLIKDWFPLIRPAIKHLWIWGGTLGGVGWIAMNFGGCSGHLPNKWAPSLAKLPPQHLFFKPSFGSLLEEVHAFTVWNAENECSTSIWSNYSDLTRPHPKW